jgi:hypothetical protein
MNPFFLHFWGIYLAIDIDVEVSSGEDDVVKKSTGDDARDRGASSAKSIAPNPIRSNVLGQIDRSIVDRAAATDPPIGAHRHKRPPPIPKRKQALPSADQVMIQIKLPPYCGPCSPLDLVAIDIIFGCLFEAFRCVSQATGTGTLVGDDTPPQ